MEIHSSSLRTLSTKKDAAQPLNKTAEIQGKARKGEPASAKTQADHSPQSTVEIEAVLSQQGLDFSTQAPINDVFNDTLLPTNVRNALDAYESQGSQLLKNQRAKLISGIDFYV